MGAGQPDPGVCLHFAGPQARMVPPRQCQDRCRAYRVRGSGADLVRKRQRCGELALPAGHARGDLVQRAQQLGQPVPVRPQDRQAQACDHHRRGQCHRSAQGRRENPHGLVPWRGSHAWCEPVLPAVFQSQPGCGRAGAADAGSGGSHGDVVAGWTAVCRRVFHANHAAGNRAAPIERWPPRDDGGDGRHQPPVGCRRSRSR